MKHTFFTNFLYGIGLALLPAALTAQTDACGVGATLLTPGLPGAACSNTAGNTTGFTDNNQGCATGNEDDEGFYRFVATATSHTVTVDGDVGFDAVVGVYNACAGTTVTGGGCVDASSDGGVETLTLTGLTIGTTYFISVHDYAAGAGTFNICITTPAAAPANDNCPGATVLPHFPNGTCTTTNATVASATQSQAGCVGTANDDVWFSFVATATTADIRVTWTQDEVVEVFSGACSGNGGSTSIICQDSPEGSVMATGLTVGQTYRFRVYDYSGTVSATPTFTVCVTTPPPPPANDNCGGAISLTHFPNGTCTTTNATVANATQSQAGCTGTANDDVWFSFVATATTADIHVTWTQDEVVEVFSGACSGNGGGTSIICQDSPEGSVLATGLTIGQTYRFRVYDYSSTVSATPTFTVCVTTPPPPPANDNCGGAISLTHFPNGTCTTTNATVANATQSQAGCTGTANDDVWFSFVATATTADIRVTWTEDEVVQVFSGACSGNGGGTSIICQDSPDGSVLATGLTVGQTYRFRVYDYYSSTSVTPTFTVCVTSPPPPPANDLCAGAIALPVNASCANTAGTTVNATYTTAQGGTPTCGSPGAPEVWYSFVAPASGALDITTTAGTMTDGVMAIYSGACGSLTQIACEDDGTAMPAISLTGLTAGATYYARVWEYSSGTGTFSICATSVTAPTNDNPCAATALAVGSVCSYNTYTNAGATPSTGIPAPGCGSYLGGDVWFTVTVPASGHLVVDTDEGVMLDGDIALYSGACGALTLIECDDFDSGNGSMGRIDRTGLTPGATIWIRVWEYGNNNNGTFSICAYDGDASSNGCAGGAGGASCATMNPFCTANTYCFTAQTGSTAETGNNYGCLSTQPNPTWYYMEISQAGNLNFNMTATSDIDFAIWGPYANLAAAQAACGSLPAPIDCSYSTSGTEQGNVAGAVIGQVYVMVVTNFANVVQDITINTAAGNTAQTNCLIVNPSCDAEAGGW